MGSKRGDEHKRPCSLGEGTGSKESDYSEAPQRANASRLVPTHQADLQPEQHAYRPGRNALTAVKQVHSLLTTGHTQIIDADLAAYFDSIPHFELLKSVARRVVDRTMLHLIQMWLEAPVEETDERGHKRRTTRNRDEKRGIPQGSPLSPLLSNIYMRRFVLGWKQLGLAERYKAHIVNYADDLVICCKGNAEEALRAMRQVMDRLRLTVNEEKTHLCRVPEQYFDFLGYTFGRCYSTQTGRAYLGTRPSRKSIRSQIESIREKTNRKRCGLAAEVVVKELNDGLRGWANYFKLGPVSKAYRAIDAYTTQRLRRWLRGKHKLRGSGGMRYSDEHLYKKLGLVRLSHPATFRGRKRESLVREPYASIGPVRFDERDVETESWSANLGTARRKGRQQSRSTYDHRATSRLDTQRLSQPRGQS
jgi:RNA-directed DNA polymerase